MQLQFVLSHPVVQTARISIGEIFRNEEPEKKKNALRRFVLPCRLYFNDSSDSEILLYGKWQKITSFGFGSSGREGDNSDFRINRELYYTWSKGMSGDIVKGYDTVAHFSLTIDPLNDTSYRQWLTPVYIEQGLMTPNPKPKEHDYKHKSFGSKGLFKGRQTTMVYWGEGRKGWIFFDTTMVAVWRADNDHLNTLQNPKKAKRWPPYLLIKPGFSIPEQVDILRIAFACRFIAEAIKPGGFF